MPNGLMIMNYIFKKSIIVAVIANAVSFTAPAVAGQASANIGILSTYISRGINLSSDKISLSPGLHYQGDQGLYMGFQAYTEGSIDPFFEIDTYAGYNKDFKNGLGYNISVLSYQFPYAKHFPENFEEVSLKGKYTGKLGSVEIGSSRFLNSIVKNDMYYHITLTKPLANGVTLSGTVGLNDYAKEHKTDAVTGQSLDYHNYQLTANWKDLTLAVDHNDNKLFDVDTKLTLSWKKYFNF
jgi:uncharacterized protein (TIGR02001 family)